MLTDASSTADDTVTDAIAAAKAAGFTIEPDAPQLGPYHGFTAERDGVRYLGLEPPVRLPPSAYLAAANLAREHDLGLLCVDGVRIALEHVLDTLTMPYRRRCADGVELYAQPRVLTHADGGVPVVPVDAAHRWVLTTDGDIELRVDGEGRLTVSPALDVTSSSLLTRDETAEGVAISDRSGRVVDRADTEDQLAIRWTTVSQPVVPFEPEYRSALPSIALLLDRGEQPRAIGTTAWWSRPAVRTHGDSSLTTTAVEHFDDRYLRPADGGLGAPTLYRRFRRWFDAVTAIAPPAPEAVFQALELPDAIVTADRIMPVPTDRTWVVPPVGDGPEHSMGGES